MPTESINLNPNCIDCNIDTIEGAEYYMVIDIIWSTTGLGPYDGKLCIGCLETRLGRILTQEDFMDAPINDPALFKVKRSDRLLNRLGYL